MTPQTTAPPLCVMKFGGTSVATPDLMRNAARRIKQCRDQGQRVVAVVSAMGDTTDRLLAQARELSDDPPKRELDVLLSAGEVQSMALLVIALDEIGIDAISFTGAQVGILTDGRYSDARIRRIEGQRIKEEIRADKVVVVAGFQGVNEAKDITTLGRGGSDTSAVALAAALGAQRCEILTDVEGVFTADPRAVPEARLIPSITYDEMLELATFGARVLHSRAVDLARRYSVPLVVASATTNAPGTCIEKAGKERDTVDMEAVVVRGITQDPAVQKISILGVPDRPGVAAAIFAILGEHGVQVRLIVQAQSHRGHNDITFIIPSEIPAPADLLERLVGEVGGDSYLHESNVGLLSVIGEGIAREPSILAQVFAVLAEEGVNIDLISTSNLVLTCVVPEEALERGARTLHARLLEEQ